MRKVSKSWVALVAATLLLGMLVGVVWARPNDRPQAADITRKVALTGGDFIPHDDAQDWWNHGDFVRCESGECCFTAPVVFPCLPSVTVERIKLHVNDDHITEYARPSIYRAYPPTGALVHLKGVDSPASVSGGIKTYTSTTISQVVWPSQKAYIWLYIGGVNIDVYGVTIEYHRNI